LKYLSATVFRCFSNVRLVSWFLIGSTCQTLAVTISSCSTLRLAVHAALPANAHFCKAGSVPGGKPGLRKQDIMVVITTTGLEDWSFGNGKSALPENCI
jgi:hypothetical protein